MHLRNKNLPPDDLLTPNRVGRFSANGNEMHVRDDSTKRETRRSCGLFLFDKIFCQKILSLSAILSISGPPFYGFPTFFLFCLGSLSPSLYLWSSGRQTSCYCLVRVPSLTGLSASLLLLRSPPLPVVVFLLFHYLPVDICISLLTLLVTNWPSSSNSPLVDLYIWRANIPISGRLYGHTHTHV